MIVCYKPGSVVLDSFEAVYLGACQVVKLSFDSAAEIAEGHEYKCVAIHLSVAAAC